MRFTKRRNKRYSGQMRLPETYSIQVDGEEQATIQEVMGIRWFWYGLGHNTLSRAGGGKDCADDIRTFSSIDSAVKDFKKFYLSTKGLKNECPPPS